MLDSSMPVADVTEVMDVFHPQECTCSKGMYRSVTPLERNVSM